MIVLISLGVGILGGIGALLRFGLDGAVDRLSDSEFPWGTLAVNMSGAFLLGLLGRLAPSGNLILLVGTGALGSYTTFSTWMLESHRLGEDGEMAMMALNLLVSAAAGLLAALAGWSLGGIL